MKRPIFRLPLLAGAMVIGFAASAQAQTAASVMKCTLVTGPVVTLKVEGGSLGYWNADRHAWVPYPCSAANFPRVECDFVISEAEYTWTLKGWNDAWDHKSLRLSINRRTGRYEFYSGDIPGGTSVVTRTTTPGECAPTTDPALSARPAPIL